jgi:predicted MFS family arabinose efflux permease
MIGLCVTFGLICAIFGGTPMKIVSNNFGYTKTFFILTLSGSLLILALIFTKIPQNKDTQDNPEFSKILKLMMNPSILFMGICSGFMVGTFEGFADVWGIMFFNEVFGFSEQESISLTSLIFMGFACGTFIVFGLQKFSKDSTLIFLSGLITCIIYVFIIFNNKISYSTLCFLMFVFGVLCQYQIIVLNFVSKIVDSQYRTVAVSIVNCINMMFGSFFHKIISYSMDMKWDGKVDELGKNIYGSDAIIWGISTIPIFCFIGMVGFACVIYKNKASK